MIALGLPSAVKKAVERPSTVHGLFVCNSGSFGQATRMWLIFFIC